MRIAHDSWTGGDKIQHAIGGFILALLSTWVSIIFWLLWEVKDGYIDYEKYGWWGGDGFSYKDFIYSLGGAIVCGIGKAAFCG